jgi:hypothetical protein
MKSLADGGSPTAVSFYLVCQIGAHSEYFNVHVTAAQDDGCGMGRHLRAAPSNSWAAITQPEETAASSQS